MKCLRCEHDNGAGHRYCVACGAALLAVPLAETIAASRGALEGERKQLTVLFADLKGSMELLSGSDPEEARRILDPVLECMIEAVHRYEGTVNQVMGDGIMALFGAPVAHEDHAVRACHAALRMQSSTRRYAERLAGAAGIAIRVGVNSGDVVVRSIGSDLHMDYTAVGQATHLAARLEQAAEPGTVLISADTLALVEGYVQVRPLEPRLVKGLAEPIALYEMLATTPVRSRFDAATARGLSRFVGREHELEQLRLALERTAAGQGQLIAVVGDAGIGKSRLFWEFANDRSAAGWRFVKCGGVAFGEAASYLHLTQLLESYFALGAHDEPDRIRAKIEARLAALDEKGLLALLPALLWLLEIPVDDEPWQRLDPPQRRQRTLAAVRDLLLAHSRAEPLVVVFENLHWIDAEARGLLDSLIENIAAARILLLVNYRPGFEHPWAGLPTYRALPIEALAPPSAQALLEALLGDDASLQPLERQLIERTEGNPLFLEETVKSLVDTRALVGTPGRYRVASPAQAMRLPATVQAILAARIDHLQAAHKRLLEAAAVLAPDVPLDILGALGGASGDELAEGLKHLQAGHFLYETKVFPNPEFTFKHALTREVVYASLLREQRERLHLLALQAIERLRADRLPELADRLAYHALQGRAWEPAARHLLQAGQRSIRRSAYREAQAHLSAGLEALAHLPATPARASVELDLLVAIGSVQLATLGWAAPQTEQTYSRAFEVCSVVGATPRLFPVLWGIATFYLIGGHIDRAVQAAERFLALARDADDDGVVVVGEFLMGNTLLWSGELERTRTHIETSLARFDPARHAGLAEPYGQDIEVTALSYRGWTLWYQGFPEQALRAHDQAVARAVARDHVHSIAYAEAVRLFGLQLRGDVAQLVDRADAAIAFADERGTGFFAAFDRYLRSWALARQAATAQAIADMRALLDAYQGTGAGLPGVAFQSMLADALLAAGQPEQALHALDRAHEMVERLHDRIWEPEVLRLKGQCLLAAGAPLDAAEACLREAARLAGARGATSWQLRASVSLARCLRGTARDEEARGVLAPVYASFAEGFELADLRDARSLLSELAAPS